MLERIANKNRIGAEWVGGTGLDVVDPATDALVAQVPSLGEIETRAAIEAAADALPRWRDLTAGERGAKLRTLHELMLQNCEALARLMTREQGKPLSESRGEIAYAAAFIDWAAEEGKRIYGETIPTSAVDKRLLVLRQPVGVTAAITPWNFPSAMITRKLGPALAAGCTMVVKPAEQTPLSALALAALAEDAGIPAGVFSVITGPPEPIARELLANPRVRMVSFTGSTEVGRILMGQAAQNVTRLGLELGGQAPFVVFDDAKVEAAVAGAVASKFRNAGQTCVCANRFLVQSGIYDSFVAGLRSEMERLRVGNGLEEDVMIGPLIDDAALEKVQAHVDDARAGGGRVRLGGDVLEIPGLARRFYAPTLIEDVDPTMRCMTEETFGPVAPVLRFDREDQAIELANDSPYGLAAYFYTRDVSRLIRVAEALEYGIVGANDGMPSAPQAPFGGVKTSGIGREGGKYAMDEFLEIKYVSIGL